MRRKLRLLDLALVALLVLSGLQLRREWLWAHEREDALLRASVKPAAVPGLPALSKVEPLTAAGYAPVAAKNLFSKDRNPTVIIEAVTPPPPPPVPPFPAARGVMLWDGLPPTVVLSEKPGGPQKGYHPGDKIGEWKIVSVDNQYVVFGWNGQEFKKRLDELLDKTPVMLAQAPAEQAPKAAAPAAAQSLSNDATSGPGADIGANLKACVAGDKSPAGTIVNGMKKVINESPFGANCRWEKVN